MRWLVVLLGCFAYIWFVAWAVGENGRGIEGPCVRRVLQPAHYDPLYRPEVFGGESNAVRELRCKNWRAIY